MVLRTITAAALALAIGCSKPEITRHDIDQVQASRAETAKDFWKYVFTELDTDKTIVFDKERYTMFFKNYKASDIEEAKNLREKLGGRENSICIKKGLKQKINEAFVRLEKYRPVIEERLWENGVNLEYAKLTVLESLCLDSIVSKAGAAGFYQFGKETAIRYGLKVNDSVDERMDPVKAAEAYARYLKDLGNMFSDEGMALTSYNHGENGMKRLAKKAAKELGKEEITLEDVKPSLGFASRNFYPSYLAILEAEKYFAEKTIEIRLAKPEKPCEIDVERFVFRYKTEGKEMRME